MAARRTTLGERLRALAEAAELSRGRASEESVSAAEALVARAGERLSLGSEHTVVALAGATGSGKSSTLNALSGTRLAAAGVTRPTTDQPMAVAWGAELPATLLDWLGVGRRHLLPAGESPLSGLVLLDLPDHDSTEVSHRLTVDRLVKLVDVMVWVVDPQKYADAALHDGYLKPLARHAEVMVVVLNQVDRLPDDERDRALADLRRLLDSEGLGATPVLAMSAVTGEGVVELRGLLERVAREKAATVRRFSADVASVAGTLSGELGTDPLPRLDGRTIAGLNESMAEAAGVPVVVDGVLRAWRHRGTIATGWPLIAWLRRLRPDPLRKLRVGLGRQAVGPTDVSRTSLPRLTSVQKARLDASLRAFADAASAGVPRGWAASIRSTVRGDSRVLADRLDAAVARADLRMDTGHGWWFAISFLQWMLITAALIGGLWLLAPLVLALLGVPLEVPMATWQGWPTPTLLLLGGVGGGILLAVLSRLFVEAGAHARARSARRVLTSAVGEVVASDVVAPVQGELDRLASAREAVARAR